MADEPRPHSWWKSLPGTLAAGTGFIAALSGLVAGLNQLSVFKRTDPTAPVQIAAPVPRESLPQPPETTTAGGSTSSAAPAATRTPTSTTPSARPAGPALQARPAAAPAADTAGPSRLPRGTALELTVPARTCAPANGQQRFTARLASPVKVEGITILPANTTAVLHLRRDGSSDAPAVRLDSLVRPDLVAAVTSATARVRRGAAGGECLRADARIAVTLTAPVSMRPR